MCKKLRINYTPDKFANPLLQVFHSTMEALVFNEEQIETEDLTVPNITVQDEQISDFIAPLDDMFGKVRFVFITGDVKAFIVNIFMILIGSGC